MAAASHEDAELLERAERAEAVGADPPACAAPVGGRRTRGGHAG